MASKDGATAEYHDNLESIHPVATYLKSDEVAALTEEHRQYLFKRHGTLNLDPLPGFGDADPYNWPQWKKNCNLVLVSFHALMATFTAASIQSAFEPIAEDLGVTLQQASYLTSLVIAILGVAPLIWRPLSSRFGRRPIFMISLIFSLVGNIGCAQSPSYSSMAVCRAITAFFICPAAAIGTGIVKETYFKQHRARAIGVWTLMITLGVPSAPFLFGFAVLRVGYRWIYYTLAIVNGIHLLLYIFLGPESRYIRQGTGHDKSSMKEEYFHFRRIDPRPLTVTEFIEPLLCSRHLTVLIPACAYAMIFLFGSIMTTIEIPQLYVVKFDFNPQQVGLQFIAVIVGSILGEYVGGFLSDWLMNKRRANTQSSAVPEFRLWLAYVGYLLVIVGAVVFLVLIQAASQGSWNIGPTIGAGIAAAGNQIVTTVLITYAVDCNTDNAASVGVFITFVRQIWGFIGPFWFPPMFAEIGLNTSSAVVSIMLIAVSIVPTVLLQIRARPRKQL